MFVGVLHYARHPVTPRMVSDVLLSVASIRLAGFAIGDRLTTIVLRNEANKGSLFVTAYVIARHST